MKWKNCYLFSSFRTNLLFDLYTQEKKSIRLWFKESKFKTGLYHELPVRLKANPSIRSTNIYCQTPAMCGGYKTENNMKSGLKELTAY